MNWIRLLHDLKNVDHTQPHPIIAEYYLCFPKLQKLPSLKASVMFKIFNIFFIYIRLHAYLYIYHIEINYRAKLGPSYYIFRSSGLNMQISEGVICLVPICIISYNIILSFISFCIHSFGSTGVHVNTVVAPREQEGLEIRLRLVNWMQ